MQWGIAILYRCERRCAEWRPSVSSQHETDQEGNPAGGRTTGPGFTISWQDGPLRDPGTGEEREPNGAQVEDIIDAALDRTAFLEDSAFSCEENQRTMEHLREAIHWQQERTRRRRERGVEGTLGI